MRLGVETLGNATLVFYERDRPVLATDPWLEGTCYCGSWALDRPLTPAERAQVLAAEYIWISHGHPDHFHPPSIAHLPTDKKILLPDHYSPEMAEWFRKRGFAVEVLAYRQWRQLSPDIRVLCLDNENQDAILLVEAGDNLVVNMNDSPLCGEERFIRKLISGYQRARTYVAMLYSNDADMMNFVDAQGHRVLDPPAQRKPGMVWDRARTVDRLGAGNYMGSASQHIYARSDSVWANPYRVTWGDVERNWSRPDIRIVEPFVVLDLETGRYERKHPAQTSDESQITGDTNGDDWAERLDAADWASLGGYFARIELLGRHVDFIEFVVGGERRCIWEASPGSHKRPGGRGVSFHAPRRSLMKTLKHGYFDDILIGNFMRAELHNMGLYPHFSPLVAKLAGASKVFTPAEWRRFNWRYFRRNPAGWLETRLGALSEQFMDRLRGLAGRLGIQAPLKKIYRRWLGDPVR